MSKQQQVKSELSKLAIREFATNAGGDKRKALRDVGSHIEERAPLCPENLALKLTR